MTDERFYCPKCEIPVEYIPELEVYTCGTCEGEFNRPELLNPRMLEKIVDNKPYDRGIEDES